MCWTSYISERSGSGITAMMQKRMCIHLTPKTFYRSIINIENEGRSRYTLNSCIFPYRCTQALLLLAIYAQQCARGELQTRDDRSCVLTISKYVRYLSNLKCISKMYFRMRCQRYISLIDRNPSSNGVRLLHLEYVFVF